jgi:hypothetical protein
VSEKDKKIKVGDLVRITNLFPHAIIDPREQDPGLGLILKDNREEKDVTEYAKSFPLYAPQNFPIECEVQVYWHKTGETSWEWIEILELVTKEDSS